MSERDRIKKIADEASRQLIDKGLIIEGGFAAFQIMTLPPDTSPAQVSDMRLAFFAGAQHLFGSMMTVLDPGDEPTERDLHRMDLIDQELRRFIAEFAA